MTEREVLLEALGHLHNLWSELVDAEEDRNPETGEEYFSCKAIREFLTLTVPQDLFKEAIDNF